MGLALSWITESFPPPSKFSIDDIPDLTGKVIIVTGASSGIGKETTKALYAHNATLYLAGRNQQKVEQVIKELKDSEQTVFKKELGTRIFFLHLDLSDLDSIKAAVNEFQSKEKDLHVLFNNAAVMSPPINQLTAQGYDLQFGTNVLGHFYLTSLLLPNLLSGAKSSADGKARVVNTSSFASRLEKTLEFESFKDTLTRKKIGTHRMYYQSKLGNVVFSNELARRYGKEGIISSSLHPGSFRTDLLRHTSKIKVSLLAPFFSSIDRGALTLLWTGTSPEGLDLNGKYLIPWAKVGAPNPAALDPNLGKTLWEWLEEQTKDI